MTAMCVYIYTQYVYKNPIFFIHFSLTFSCHTGFLTLHTILKRGTLTYFPKIKE